MAHNPNVIRVSERTPDAVWLDDLIALLQSFREFNPDATINQAIGFLAIARESNITQREVLRILQMKTSGTSRIISILSKYGDKGNDGWNLIASKENIYDRREKLLQLTPHGHNFLGALRAQARSLSHHLAGVAA